MIKRFIQCACMALAVCMLLTALPFSSLAQEIPAPSATPAQTAGTKDTATPVANGKDAATAQATESAPASDTVPATDAPTVEVSESPAPASDAVPTVEVSESPAPADNSATDATEVPADAPATDATEAPATDAPATDATEAPATDAPATDATELPADAPATDATEVPADAPATDAAEVPSVEPTPELAETPAPAIVSFDLNDLPEGIAVPYGTEEAELGLPKTLTANFSDGTSAPVAVVWVCVDDGNGNAAYDPMAENPAALFTFEAALVEALPCEAELPRMGVVFADTPTPMSDLTVADFGIVASENASAEVTDTPDGYQVWLDKGTFTIDSELSMHLALLSVCLGAELIANVDINNVDLILVCGGTADLGGTKSVEISAGSATIRPKAGGIATVGNIKSIGGILTLNNTVVTGNFDVIAQATLEGSKTKVNNMLVHNRSSSKRVFTVTVRDGATVTTATVGAHCHLQADSANLGTLTMNGGSCNISNSSSIGTLNIDALPASGKILVADNAISDISFSETTSNKIAEAYWPADRVLLSGEVAPAFDVNVGPIDIEGLSMPSSNFRVSYSPVDGTTPMSDGANVAYTATIYDSNSIVGTANLNRAVTTRLVLAGGEIEKIYDGNGEFKGAAVKNPTWHEMDVNGNLTPYTGTLNSGFDVSATAILANAEKNAGTYSVTPTQVSISGTVPENVVFLTDEALLPNANLSATITKKAVTLSGTIYRKQGEGLTWAQAAAQRTLAVEDLLNGETFASLGVDFELTGPCDGSNTPGNLLTDDFSGYLESGNSKVPVTSINPTEATNYSFNLNGLCVSYPDQQSKPTITTDDWYMGPGQKDFPEPVLGSRGYDDRPVTYAYRPADSADETAWAADAPTAAGDYQVRATLAAYNEYIQETTEPANFSIKNLTWSVELELKSDKPNPEYGDVITATATVVGQGSDDFKTGGRMALYSGDTQIVDLVRVDEKGTYKATFGRDPGAHQLKALYTPKDGTPISSNIVELNVSKKDISADFRFDSSDGTYNGLKADSGAYIKLSFPEHWEGMAEELKVTIRRNYENYTPKDGEVVRTETTIRFTPHLGGGYSMEVEVDPGNKYYMVSEVKSRVHVDARWLTFVMEDSTVEQGQPFTPAYKITDGELVDGDVIEFECYYDGDWNLTDTSRLEVGDNHTYSVKAVTYWADGTDERGSYATVFNKIGDDTAKLTVAKARRPVGVSFSETEVLTEKTLNGTWTPNLTKENVELEAEYTIHFYGLDDQGEYENLDDIIKDSYMLTWRDAEGNELNDAPTDAGTYTLLIELAGDAEVSNDYALRIGDTLTFTIPPLDLGAPDSDIGFLMGKPVGTYDYTQPGYPVIPDDLVIGSESDGYELVWGTHYYIYPVDGGNWTKPGDASIEISGYGSNVVGVKALDYTIVAPTRFTVTIPASVEIPAGDPNGEGRMTIGCTLQGSKPHVTVEMTSASGYQLGSDGAYAQYGVFLGDASYPGPSMGLAPAARFWRTASDGDDALAESPLEQELRFSFLRLSPLLPGTYTDTLTFTVKLVDENERS